MDLKDLLALTSAGFTKNDIMSFIQPQIKTARKTEMPRTNIEYNAPRKHPVLAILRFANAMAPPWVVGPCSKAFWVRGGLKSVLRLSV